MAVETVIVAEASNAAIHVHLNIVAIYHAAVFIITNINHWSPQEDLLEIM